MLAFSSSFGLMFTFFPQHLLSMFWDEEEQEPVEGEAAEAPVAQTPEETPDETDSGRD